jgi:hypothetical protein
VTPERVTASVILPEGWKQKGASPQIEVPAMGQATLSLPVIAPTQENKKFAEIRINVVSGSSFEFQASLFVKVSPYVAEQMK